MGVFFRFRNTKLPQPLFGNIFAEGIFQALGRERHKHVFDFRVVLRHADIANVKSLALKAAEIRVDYGAGQLPCPVGTEIEENHRVAVPNFRAMFAAERQNKFIGDSLGVAVFDPCGGVAFKGHFTPNNGVVMQLHALPALVPVHAVVAPADGGNFSYPRLCELPLQRLDISLSACGRNVPAVHKAVNVNFFKSVAFCHVDKGEKVLNVAVNAAVGQKPHKMQSAAALLGVLHGGNEGGIFEKFTIVNGLCDARQRLIDNSARADIGMPHLGISHLPLRQTHVHSGGADNRHGALRLNSVKVRHFCGANGVAVVAFAVPEPVKYHQNKRFHKISFYECGLPTAKCGKCVSQRICGVRRSRLGSL